MDFEPRDQFEQREKKLRQIEDLGYEAFPREFRWTDRPGEILGKHGDKDGAALACNLCNAAQHYGPRQQARKVVAKRIVDALLEVCKLCPRKGSQR